MLAFLTTLALLSYLVFTDRINLAGKTTASSLSSYSAKLEFLFRCQTLNLACLMFSFFNVVFFRATTEAINPLAGHEHLTQRARNILNHTMEQYLISLSAQLVSLCYLSAVNILRVIPLINLLFIIGRVTFWLGYPDYRFYGNNNCILPSLMLTCYNIYSFLQS